MVTTNEITPPRHYFIYFPLLEERRELATNVFESRLFRALSFLVIEDSTSSMRCNSSTKVAVGLDSNVPVANLA
ncbi:Hypothetical predicted protein [Olea europaea subsp. europaea]|uniref:Uncharacterized protein n=1 Tax=Olea europaea subsp. europaea TaxID=158383 RepID=A0A8S0P6H1_OLEEU|nr:Hypothetical predicted protein [Olea europaea subsp. europaea]